MVDNLFSAENYPTSEPDALVAGDLWAWKRPDITEAYPPASYTLKYELTGLESPYPLISITAAKVSSAHVVEVSSTGSNTAMGYRWRAIVVRDADSAEVTVDQGLLTVAPSYADTTDASSYTYRVLQKIRATIEGTASREEASYSIGGRSLSARSPGELLDLEREFRKRWQREKDEISRKAGRPTGRRVLVGMRA